MNFIFSITCYSIKTHSRRRFNQEKNIFDLVSEKEGRFSQVYFVRLTPCPRLCFIFKGSDDFLVEM